MSVSSFPYGIVSRAEAVTVSLLSGIYTHNSLTPTDAKAGVSLSIGTPALQNRLLGAAAPDPVHVWCPSPLSPSNYSVRCTVNSGTTPSGDSTGSWLALTIARGWYIQDTAPVGPNITCDLTLELALTSDTSTILATAGIILNAHENLNGNTT